MEVNDHSDCRMLFYQTWVRGIKRHRWRYYYLLPALCAVVLIAVYPAVVSFGWSVWNTKYLARTSFSGLGNYIEFFSSYAGRRALSNTAVFLIGTVGASMLVGLGAAVLLTQPIKLGALFLALILMPWTLSQTVIALLFKWLLNPYYGPLTGLLERVGAQGIDLLSHPNLALITLTAINVWRLYPYGTVLIFAALKTVPQEVKEAARIDGAGPLQVFRLITLPLIQSTLVVVLILLSLESLNMVTMVFVATGGGPIGRTETLGVHLFVRAFHQWQIGYSSAVGVIMFILNIVVGIAYIYALRRRDDV